MRDLAVVLDATRHLPPRARVKLLLVLPGRLYQLLAEQLGRWPSPSEVAAWRDRMRLDLDKED